MAIIKVIKKSDGGPAKGYRVGAGNNDGFIGEGYTNDNGTINLPISGSNISIYVEGAEKLRGQPCRGTYDVAV